jgi:hypothetical protein
MDTLRVCSKCGDSKIINDFRCKNGKVCKQCYKEQHDISRKNRSKIDKDDIDKEKICTICRSSMIIKDLKSGSNICKKCHAERNMKYYNNRKEDIRKNIRNNMEKKQSTINNMKNIICKECSNSISPSEFNISVNKCKDCHRKKHREYMSSRKKDDPLFKFIANCRTRIYKIFVSKNNLRTKDLLGEELSFIEKWFKFCFVDTMTWENQGSGWHIDHVIPISKFDISSEKDVVYCFNWKNLSPLSSIKNITKKDNIIHSQIQEHINKLRLFISTYDTDKQNEVEEYISNIFLPYLTNN